MKKKLLACFVLLLSFAFAKAQNITVHGKVIDAKTNQGVAYVTVSVKGEKIETITNEGGYFTIAAPVTGFLVINDVRYAAIEVAVKAELEIIINEKVNVLSDVTVVGSRNVNRSVANSPVPIDLIDLKSTIKTSPQIDLNQMLTYLAPSFNSTRQSSSDGTEHVDPASLRGLGPDQTLVLINGKRQHTTSLLNNQGTFGNGSVGTDLNAIPAAAIDHIEILRDGASAQYGSDAIAGVINVVLKKNTNALNAVVTGGVTSRGDGATTDESLNWGGSLGKNGGYINVTGEFLYRGKTTRTQQPDLIIYDQSSLGNFFAYPFTASPHQSRLYDDSVIAAHGLTRNDFNFQIGDARILNGSAMYNLSLPSKNQKAEFYSFGNFNYRNGTGFGFRRLPSEVEHMVYSIFPDGYQPNTESHIYDETFALGYKFETGGWNIDISNIIGDNRFDYAVNNTVNASMQEKSPTTFKAGGHEFLQNTLNFDASKNFSSVLNGFNLAMGAEFRYEQYKIRAGEEASWRNYGLVTRNDGTIEDTLGLAGGSQSFPGFTPFNAGSHNRNNLSAYADGELDVTKNFMIGGAVRFEHYSDFGSTVNGKLDTRIAINKVVALRAAVSTGFRAPSLHQQYFSYVSTDLVNGKIANSGFFPNNSDVAAFIGIPKLKEETSINASAGFTITPNKDLHFTIDGYYIKVKNRITLTGNFGQDVYGDVDPVIQAYLLPYGANTARFFTNSIDTRTLGVDVVGTYVIHLDEGNRLDFVLAANYNNNKVGDDLNIPEKLQSQPDIYFSPAERSLIEGTNPKLKVNFTVNYKFSKFNLLVRNVYFGPVIRNGFPFGKIQHHESRVVTDVALGYDITKDFYLSIGANNLLDMFPEKQIYPNSYFGVFKYAPVQMGTDGMFVFVRAALRIPENK